MAFPVKENWCFAEYLNLTKGNTGFMLKAHWESPGKERVQRGEKLKLSACFSFMDSKYKKSQVFYIFNTHRNPIKCFPDLQREDRGSGSTFT